MKSVVEVPAEDVHAAAPFAVTNRTELADHENPGAVSTSSGSHEDNGAPRNVSQQAAPSSEASSVPPDQVVWDSPPAKVSQYQTISTGEGLSASSIIPQEKKIEIPNDLGQQNVPTTEDSQRDDCEDVLSADAHSAALNFAMEHRILLRAVLDLLAERDRHAPVVGMNDPFIVKSGPLKKASHLVRGTWKVKYVEIRRGMFSYYENAVSKDATGEGELLRKDIPLEAHSCTCRAVKLHQKALKLAPGGALFELTVNGSKRLWMANSRQEREAWIQAVNNAMAGASVTRGDSSTDHRGLVRGVNPRSPFRSDLRQFLKTQTSIRNAGSKLEYMAGLRDLLDHSLKVPVKWIAKQGVLATESTDVAFQEATVASSIDQLWKDLQRDSVCIDNELFRGDSDHGPEKIMGALMRRLLFFGNSSESSRGRHDLSETQALTYARDILLSANRTRTGGDCYFCINALCKHSGFVVIVPSAMAAEPVVINVSEDISMSSSLHGMGDKSGWIRTRNKLLQRNWKKLFFVLSEGTLSYYESALPRPHRLRGQLALTDATVTITSQQPNSDGKPSTQFVMLIATKEKERQLLFQSEDRLLDWTYAIECVSKAKGSSEPNKKNNRRRLASDEENTKKTDRHQASLPAENDTPSTKLEGINLAVQATKDHAAGLGLDPDAIESRISMYARKKTSILVVSVEASTEYKVCTIDPQGDESEDTWAVLRTTFLQNFRITGGSHGRIERGEELVHVSVVDCIDMLEDAPELVEPASPGRRTSRNRRIFRSFNNSDDGEDIVGGSD
jgi:hypothetical protein